MYKYDMTSTKALGVGRMKVQGQRLIGEWEGMYDWLVRAYTHYQHPVGGWGRSFCPGRGCSGMCWALPVTPQLLAWLSEVDFLQMSSRHILKLTMRDLIFYSGIDQDAGYFIA